MRIGSLFSGIGGLELGLERAGVGHTVWQVEKDPYCRQVLARHWPDAVRYEDVTTVDWSAVEPVEVLCGGFPCQDISLAGTGAGLAGERSGLWREYLRAIRDLRPRFVVVENVAALLVRGFGDVLADLASSGYDAEWDCVPAAAVGAPHRRDRLFVVAYTDGDGFQGLEGSSSRRHEVHEDQRHHPHGRSAAVGDADGLARSQTVALHGQRGPMERPGSIERAVGPDGGVWGGWEAEPDVGRVVDGLPTTLDLDRLRALGNAVVPQVAEIVGRRLLELAA